MSPWEIALQKEAQGFRQEVLAFCAEHGVERVEATFSGGGDEGSLEDLRFWDENGEHEADWGSASAPEGLWELMDGGCWIYCDYNGSGVQGSLTVDAREQAVVLEYSVEDWIQQEPIHF